MRVYFDVSCLNRPFDDQTQSRIRLEAEAVTIALSMCDQGRLRQIASTVSQVEIGAMSDPDRRRKVRALLPATSDIIELESQAFQRAAALQRLGFKPADALHLAAAEQAEVDLFLSCDDRLCRRAKRVRLSVRVANPVAWLQEIEDAENT